MQPSYRPNPVALGRRAVRTYADNRTIIATTFSLSNRTNARAALSPSIAVS